MSFRGSSCCIALSWLVLLCNAPLFADIVDGESDAFGAFVDLDAISGTVNANIGPLAPIAGTAPAPYDSSNQALNVAVSDGDVLGVGNLINLNAGAFDTNATSTVDGLAGSRTTSATTLISGLDTIVGDFADVLLDDLITITADTIDVASEITGDIGALTAVGSMVVENLQINVLGQVVDLSTVIANGVVAPNTTISLDAFGLTGATLTLNQQLVSGDGINTSSIETNAIVINMDAVTVGGFTGLNGDVIIGHTAASMTAVPEPSSMMLTAGLAVVTLASGGIRRLRRKKPAAA